MADSIKKQTLSGIKWSAIESYANQGIQFLLGLIMARLLLPSDYGIIGMVAIFFAVSQSFVDSGFGEALIRKQDRTEVDFSTMFYFNIFVAALCYVILFFIAPYIAIFFKEPILTDVVRVVGITVIINSFKIIQTTKFTIEVNFKSIAKASLISRLISGVLGVFFAYTGHGLWSLVYQNIIASVLDVCLLWKISNWRPQWKFSWKSLTNMFSYGSKILASGLIHTLYININTLCIGKFYSPADLGYYSRGCQFPQLLGQNFTSVVQRVTFPILAKIQDDDDRLVGVYRKYIKLVSMFLIFALMLLVALGKPLVLVLLSDTWSDAVIYLQIFAFAMMTDHVTQLNLNLLKVKGRSDLILKLEIVKKTISFVILIAAIPLGVLAICISKVVYSQIATFINTYYSGKLFGLSYASQIKDFLPYVMLSIISCAPTFVLSFTGISNTILLIGGVLISPLLYLGMLYLSRDSVFIEFCIPVLKKVFKHK